MEFRILSGASGMDKDRMLDKIRRFASGLRIAGRRTAVEAIDVDAKLCELVPRDLYRASTERPRILSIVEHLPQDQVRSFWRRAFEASCQEVQRRKPDLAIVVLTLSYYRKSTYEFYCPADLSRLSEMRRAGSLPPTGGILTLIDDVFDAYWRLSRRGQVFDIQNLVSCELGDSPGNQSDRYKRALALVLQSLIRILEWRESEIQHASSVGSLLDWPFLAVGVKHPTETVVRHLLGNAASVFELDRSLFAYL